MKRRDIIKGLSILPLAGTLNSFEPILGAKKKTSTAASIKDIYESIGVEPVINCKGTFTIIGGSVQRPEVMAAIQAASTSFAQVDEVAIGIGQRLADLTGAEWGMVSAGCASGLKHITAACVTGGNPEKLVRIPNLAGFDKTQVIIPRRSRMVYDHAIRNIGVEIVTVDSMEELENAINPKTAMIFTTTGSAYEPGGEFSTEEIAKIAKAKNVPYLVDAAAEDLTIPNVHLQRGADMVSYSGGKAICGPQSAGLNLGRKDILMSAWQASSPHHGPGRDNKVGKEEMIGMLAAVEAWIARDHAEKERIWMQWVNNMSKKVSTLPGIQTTIREPKGRDNRSARLTISWDASTYNITGPELTEVFASTHRPRIAISGSHNEQSGMSSLHINASQMQAGEDKIVADSIHKVLSTPREKTNKILPPPSEIIAGQWDVDIEFSSSKERHTFMLEQKGREIDGLHKGYFTTRPIMGTLDGDHIKLKSSERGEADNVPFSFYGTVKGDSMTGGIYMGEYLRAKFTATRVVNTSPRREIVIPSGQPLSS
jgi:L-seryl-tRNA(Ser) seleniumtransferase